MMRIGKAGATPIALTIGEIGERKNDNELAGLSHHWVRPKPQQGRSMTEFSEDVS